MKLARRALATLPILTGGLLAVLAALLLLVRTERTVEAGGEVRVERYAVIRPQTGGMVEAVLVEAGQPVRRGQILVRLQDPGLNQEWTTAERELAEARVRWGKLERELQILSFQVHPLETEKKRLELRQEALSAAASATRVAEQKIELETVEARLQRAERLAAAGLLSEQQLDEARLGKRTAEERFRRSELEDRLARSQGPALDTDLRLQAAEQRLALDGLRAGIEEAGQEVHRLRAVLDRLAWRRAALHIRAGLDGVVVGEPGRDLQGKRVEPGEKLFLVVDPASIYFVAGVSEFGVVRVRTGQQVMVEISGLPRQRFDSFSGRVEKVAQEPAAAASGQVAYPVEIRLAAPWINLEDGRFFLRSGMRGLVRIAYRRDVPLIVSLYELLAGERPAAT